jgi:polyhydroxyalkanoate synthesis regulator phasin
MATREQIADLKRQWEADPCWDLEDTEDFEQHHDELLAYSQECQQRWEKNYQVELLKYAEVLGLSSNPKLAERIRTMERRIEQLEAQ